MLAGAISCLQFVGCQSKPQRENTLYRRPASITKRTVFVHLFEWTWRDIARECKEVLGPAGFAAVQISPPSEHVVLPGHPWYQRYQPVSYKIESRSGTRAEFSEMIRTCQTAGVDIYADAVINHMTGVLGAGEIKAGNAESRYGRYSYPGLYDFDDFHHCGRNGTDDIQNYSDRYEVQTCELVNLADLNTGSPKVRAKIVAYLKDLLSLGVKGFRIDAAKHMANADLAAIIRELPESAYIFQEVIDQGGEAVQANEYFASGDVTEFKYSLDIGRIFLKGKLAWLNEKNRFGEGWGYMPSHRAIVFIDNHDNQRGHGGGGNVLTHKDQQNYELANLLMLAWPYGYPSVMSSFAFASAEQGPPSKENGETLGIGNVGCLKSEQSKRSSSGWVCEHRWPSIKAMVKFRNATAGDFTIDNWWSNGDNQISFSRGRSGFFALNHQSTSLVRKFQTGLPPGSYCNILNIEKCAATVVDKEGFAHITVAPESAIALYINQRAN